MNTPHVLILDDRPIIAGLIQNFLQGEVGFRVVTSVSTLAQAQEKLGSQGVDIVIVDMLFNNDDGLSLLKWLHQKQLKTKILVLAQLVGNTYVDDIVRYGVSGLLYENTLLTELKSALTRIARGETYFSAAATKNIVASVKANYQEESVVKKINNLTAREKEVLSLVVDGCTNAEIADEIAISIRTVENHRANILRKTGGKNFFHLAKIICLNQLLGFNER
jgi:DNA-binding NarL/FixJ family response regulator